MEEIKEIVENEFEVQGKPALRKFAEWLTEGFSKNGNVLSHASILNWLDGKPPKTDFLEDMLSIYPQSDRRFSMALRLLAVKSPHVWGVDGVVWTLREKLSNKAE